ncbi:MAG: hypothetical protein HY964_08650 [Ignavibacteriales bacterium]|nr:hypothetical protein [Ignavibacteriales bacterium]
MKTIYISIIILSLLFLSLAWVNGDNSKQIKFSHTFHIEESLVECTVCHYKAATSVKSSDNLTGDHESCKTCHEDVLANNCSYCHLDPDNIQPLKQHPREIIFSHEKHTAKSIECTNCHRGLDEVKYASSDNMPSMDLCVTCHEKNNVSKDCNTCHTNLIGLIPKTHLEGEFKKDHKRQTRFGGVANNCSTCHDESFCQNCHAGIELKKYDSKKEYSTDPSARIQLKDSPKELKLQQVHELNYKFTHSIDARSKRIDCNSCHDQSTFCVECHQTSGNINQMKIKPLNHSEPGFKLFGKGSGGGTHAKLAHRDIEYCASCHDVEGADPVCMMCHTEKIGD